MVDKRKRAAYTAAQIIWLIELSVGEPTLSTSELGRRFAEYVNEVNSKDLVPFEPPAKNTINDGKRWKSRRSANSLIPREKAARKCDQHSILSLRKRFSCGRLQWRVGGACHNRSVSRAG